MDLADLARLDQFPRQPHGGHEVVVEGAHVHHACLLDALPDLVRLRRVPAERLLADDVLPGLGRGDRRLRVQVVRAAVVEQSDLGVADELAPVGHVSLEAVAPRRLAHRSLVTAGDRHEPRLERRRPRHVRELVVRVRVRLPHERVAEHPDADLRHCAIVGTWQRP